MRNNFEIFTLDQLTKEGNHLKIKVNTSFDTINSLIFSLKKEVKNETPSFLFLENTCYDLICRLPLPIHFFNNTFLLRARPNESKLFSNQSEISYNSENPNLITLQRFNLDREQVFYSAAPVISDNANGAVTAIIESFKEIFDEKSNWQYKVLTIGRWQIQKPIKLITLAFYDEALKKSIHMQNILHYFQLFLDSAFEVEDQIKCSLFYGYFSECAGKVIDTKNNYLLTTAFYHAIRRYYGTDIGILYSSAKTENAGLNIVLSKEIIDSDYLKLDMAFIYELIKNPNNNKHIAGAPTMQAKVEDSGNFKFEMIRHNAEKN